jgi:hypothetical protein
MTLSHNKLIKEQNRLDLYMRLRGMPVKAVKYSLFKNVKKKGGGEKEGGLRRPRERVATVGTTK